MKKIYRSRSNKTITGLLGGVGEYFNIDPVIVRVIFVVLLVLTKVWPLLLLYAIGYLVVPIAPDVIVVEEKDDQV